MRCARLVIDSGSTSLANPGSIPLTCSVAPPRAAAASTCSTIDAGRMPCGNCSTTGPLDTTLIPASRNLVRSLIDSTTRSSVIAVCTMQSGARANSSSTSDVATTPSSRPRPANSPASRPTFAGSDTHTPTNSRSGWASIPTIACFPTVPVDHSTTRRLMPTKLEHVPHRRTVFGQRPTGRNVGNDVELRILRRIRPATHRGHARGPSNQAQVASGTETTIRHPVHRIADRRGDAGRCERRSRPSHPCRSWVRRAARSRPRALDDGARRRLARFCGVSARTDVDRQCRRPDGRQRRAPRRPRDHARRHRDSRRRNAATRFQGRCSGPRRRGAEHLRAGRRTHRGQRDPLVRRRRRRDRPLRRRARHPRGLRPVPPRCDRPCAALGGFPRLRLHRLPRLTARRNDLSGPGTRTPRRGSRR